MNLFRMAFDTGNSQRVYGLSCTWEELIALAPLYGRAKSQTKDVHVQKLVILFARVIFKHLIIPKVQLKVYCSTPITYYWPYETNLRPCTCVYSHISCHISRDSCLYNTN